jgi:hypothetical protein
MDTEEEDKGCVIVIQCTGTYATAGGWRTHDASWLSMEEADNGEVLVVNVMQAGKERLPKCLMNEEEF